MFDLFGMRKRRLEKSRRLELIEDYLNLRKVLETDMRLLQDHLDQLDATILELNSITRKN